MEAQEVSLIRDNFLLRSVWSAWLGARYALRKSAAKKDAEERYIAQRFRMIYLGPKILEAMKASVEEAKMERMREQHNQMMWNKVQLWLGESETDS
jgi:hypothetical protein